MLRVWHGWAARCRKAAMRKRKNERREMDISQVDWMQLLRTGELQQESLIFLKQLCKVRVSKVCVCALTSRRHET